jgi:hypothetical protein
MKKSKAVTKKNDWRTMGIKATTRMDEVKKEAMNMFLAKLTEAAQLYQLALRVGAPKLDAWDPFVQMILQIEGKKASTSDKPERSVNPETVRIEFGVN